MWVALKTIFRVSTKLKTDFIGKNWDMRGSTELKIHARSAVSSNISFQMGFDCVSWFKTKVTIFDNDKIIVVCQVEIQT